MSLVGSYRFQTGVSAFFEMATSDARAVLPPHLEPIEVRHQRSVLSVNAFLFDDSVVGPYTEVMFAVIVPPLVAAWGQHAKAGLFPFLAATSSEEARRIKSERFHFPYHEQTIDAQFIETDDRVRIRIFGGGRADPGPQRDAGRVGDHDAPASGLHDERHGAASDDAPDQRRLHGARERASGT